MKFLFVSVIIPVYHDWDRLSLCLQALESQTYPKEFIEIIVINNDCDDDVPSWFCVYENCIILTEGRPGSYAARNRGLKESRGDIIAFTDSDCIPEPEWLERAITYFDNNKGVGRVAGRIELFFIESKQKKSSLVELYERAYAFPQKMYVDSYGVSVTANLLVRSNVISKVGMFNEEQMSGGDMDWGERASKLGVQIRYVPSVIVKHPARNNWNDLLTKARRVAGAKRKKFNARISGRSKAFMELLLALKPPINDVYQNVYKKGEFSLSDTVKIFIVKYIVRIVQGIEIFKVVNGYASPERR